MKQKFKVELTVTPDDGHWSKANMKSLLTTVMDKDRTWIGVDIVIDKVTELVVPKKKLKKVAKKKSRPSGIGSHGFLCVCDECM